MKLFQTLFSDSKTLIYRVTSNGNWNNFQNWKLTPIEAPIVAAEYLPKRRLDGVFLLPAKYIQSPEHVEDCLVQVTLPERIAEFFFYIQDNEVVKGLMYQPSREVIPAIAIDHFGNYELFYSRIKPEIGINVLRRGLAIAKRKSNIASDLGYILRDEKRYGEAIEAFSISVAEEGRDFDYINRAQLYDFVGNKEKADKEWKFIEKKWGKDLVNDSRLLW